MGFPGEDRFAIHHCGNLVVAGTEIETDAASFQMSASRHFHILRRRNRVCRGKNHFERMPVSGRHHLAIELALTRF